MDQLKKILVLCFLLFAFISRGQTDFHGKNKNIVLIIEGVDDHVFKLRTDFIDSMYSKRTGFIFQFPDSVKTISIDIEGNQNEIQVINRYIYISRSFLMKEGEFSIEQSKDPYNGDF